MSVDPRTYYDNFSRTYNQRRGHGYHALVDELETDCVPSAKPLRILEAGCGTGLVLNRLKSRGQDQIVGIDLSSGMLGGARREGHSVAQASVTALPFGESTFDVVYCFKVLAHVPDVQRALAEFARVLRPGGYLIAEFYNRHSLRGLRWQVKRVVGGEKTSAEQRETQLFTRYDSLADMIGYLPRTVRLEQVRGIIVATPAAAFLEVPLLSGGLHAAERWLATSPLARFGGFAVLVARRS